RKAPDAGADRVGDGVGDRSGGRHGGRLADSHGGGVVDPVVDGHENGFDLRHVERAGDLVLLHVGVDHEPAGLVQNAVFVKSVGETLDDATLNLALRRQRVDDQPAVVHGDD